MNPSLSVIVPPESLTAYHCWQYHGVQSNECSTEAAEFLDLCEGRQGLFDIGAQTGFMSALFARSRAKAQILSVEPDRQVLPILERAVELNANPKTKWVVIPIAISDRDGMTTIPISNRVYESRSADQPSHVEVECKTLEGLCSGNPWQPDVIKVDVESFEHEIICSSLALLERCRPALQLEVHWRFLEWRQLSARDFLGPLWDMGYRGIRRRYRTIDNWMRIGRLQSTSRFSLRAD